MPFILQQQLAAAWLTLNWVIGYGVAPVLFSHLDAEVAGEIMAVLLSTTYWLDGAILGLMGGMICLSGKWTRREGWLLLAFVAVVLNLAWLSPLMAELKQLPLADAKLLSLGFSAWHGVSQLVFLVAWVAILLWMFFSIRAYQTGLSTLHK